jgi:hypothetical protein
MNRVISDPDRACIAEIGVLTFLSRMGQTNADASYNIAWMGLGIVVACMLSMPKLVDTKGSSLLAKLSGYQGLLVVSSRGFHHRIPGYSGTTVFSLRLLHIQTCRVLTPLRFEMGPARLFCRVRWNSMLRLICSVQNHI